REQSQAASSNGQVGDDRVGNDLVRGGGPARQADGAVKGGAHGAVRRGQQPRVLQQVLPLDGVQVEYRVVMPGQHAQDLFKQRFGGHVNVQRAFPSSCNDQIQFSLDQTGK